MAITLCKTSFIFWPCLMALWDLSSLLLLSHFSRVWLCVTHRRQPTRLPHPWDSPGKNTGVGCHSLLQCMKVKVKSLSHVRLFATPWTAAYQAPPSMGFSRQEYWSGVPSPSPLVHWLTWALSSESTKSEPLDCQGISDKLLSFT